MKTSSFIFLRALAISLIFLPVYLLSSTSFVNSKEKSANSETNSNITSKPATKKELRFYEAIGMTVFCSALKTEVEYPKALGIASSTFANIISEVHGGFVEESPGVEFGSRRLFEIGQMQIQSIAVQTCPELIPEKEKKEYVKRRELQIKRAEQELKKLKKKKR